MDKKEKRFISVLLALFFLLVIAQSVSAQLLVSVDPQEETEFLYPFEVAFYKVSYYNSGDEVIEDLEVKVVVSEDLRLVEDDKEVIELSFELDSIEPRTGGEKKVKVKALEASGSKNYVTVSLGKKVFTHSVSTFIEVRENPVDIRARIEKSSISPGEESTIYLDIENRGSKPLTNLSASLALPEGIELISQPAITETLSPQQSVLNSQFIFRASGRDYGKKRVALQVSYLEEGASHVIEKSFEVDVGEREAIMFLMVGVIIGLILVSFFLGKKRQSRAKPKEEVKPEAKPEKKEKK